MAKTIASCVRMTNDWLAGQRTLSLMTLREELAHSSWNRLASQTLMPGGTEREPGRGILNQFIQSFFGFFRDEPVMFARQATDLRRFLVDSKDHL
jgi:hypothetical protein